MENEKRLIDANDLKWKIGQVCLYVASLRCGKTIISKLLESYRKAVFEEIENAPTIDAEEVIHCKDCKHWADGVRGCTDHVKCCQIGFYMVGENGYCVFGERKEDGRNEV